MKQYKIVNAYNALYALSEASGINKKEQWEIYRLRNILKPHFEFHTEQENKVREKYGEYADDAGNLSGEYADNFVKEMQEVNDIDVELDGFIKPQIRMTEGITLKISDPLDGFVDFLPPEE